MVDSTLLTLVSHGVGMHDLAICSKSIRQSAYIHPTHGRSEEEKKKSKGQDGTGRDIQYNAASGVARNTNVGAISLGWPGRPI